MSYPYLGKVNKLPTVGVIQKLLNARASAGLVVDGVYGDKTAHAVGDFQESRPRIKERNGCIDRETYAHLTQCENRLQIIDFVDIFDIDMLYYNVNAIYQAGGIPIEIGGMSNGIGQGVTEILRTARTGSVFLLRFFGHGAPGRMRISHGNRALMPGTGNEHLSSILDENWKDVKPILERLRPIFGPYGSVEFHHCSVAKGKSGRSLMKKIAETLGVPATGGFEIQYPGGLYTFTLEGPTYTAIPGGRSLKTWCQAMPDFIPMTIF